MKTRFFTATSILLIIVLLTLFIMARFFSAIAQNDIFTERASIASDGSQANGFSSFPSISSDGRYVAFYSYATNLVMDDTNNWEDLFVRDRQTGQTIFVAAVHNSANRQLFDPPSLSADGRYVAFESWASNLVPGDTGGRKNVYVYDQQTGQITLISVALDGSPGNLNSNAATISADGHYIAFESDANNLVSSDINGNLYDIFVRDRQTGQTTLVSVSSNGSQGNKASNRPAISSDGRFVAFESIATNLVSSDTNSAIKDIFVHDLATGQTTLVSVSSDGSQGNRDSGNPAISADGRYVAFESASTNLVPDKTTSSSDVFVHDRQTGETIRVSIASDGSEGNGGSDWPSLSADGRYVAFQSWASNLVPSDTNNTKDIFVHDRQTGETIRVSIAFDNSEGNQISEKSFISSDGRYIAFQSGASNLVPNDTNNLYDVFVRSWGGEAAPTPTPTSSPTSTPTPTPTPMSSSDFELFSLDWSPNEPEVMEDARVDVTIRNVGADYIPESGQVYLDLKLLDTDSSGEPLLWRFPGQINSCPTYGFKQLTIDRFWFTNDRVDKVEACVTFEDPESNTSNNCFTRDITVRAASHPWRACAAVPIDALMLIIDIKTAGGLNLALELSKLLLANEVSLKIACEPVNWDLSEETCREAHVRYIVDGAITLATEGVQFLSPIKAIIAILKDIISTLQSLVDCVKFLFDYVSAFIVEARLRGQPVNAVIAHSPIYLRVVDETGRRAGFLDDGSPILEIPDAEVAERNGAKIILYPGTNTQSVELIGTGSGTFDLIVIISVSGNQVHSINYQDVSIIADATGKIDVASGQYTLVMDDNGDGTTDREIQPDEEIRKQIYQVYLPIITKK